MKATEERHRVFYYSFWGTVSVIGTLVLLFVSFCVILAMWVQWNTSRPAMAPRTFEPDVRKLTSAEEEASRRVRVGEWKFTPTQGDGVWHSKLTVTLINTNGADAFGAIRLCGYDRRKQRCFEQLLPVGIGAEQTTNAVFELILAEELWQAVREWRVDWR